MANDTGFNSSFTSDDSTGGDGGGRSVLRSLGLTLQEEPDEEQAEANLEILPDPTALLDARITRLKLGTFFCLCEFSLAQAFLAGN